MNLPIPRDNYEGWLEILDYIPLSCLPHTVLEHLTILDSSTALTDYFRTFADLLSYQDDEITRITSYSRNNSDVRNSRTYALLQDLKEKRFTVGRIQRALLALDHRTADIIPEHYAEIYGKYRAYLQRRESTLVGGGYISSPAGPPQQNTERSSCTCPECAPPSSVSLMMNPSMRRNENMHPNINPNFGGNVNPNVGGNNSYVPRSQNVAGNNGRNQSSRSPSGSPPYNRSQHSVGHNSDRLSSSFSIPLQSHYDTINTGQMSTHYTTNPGPSTSAGVGNPAPVSGYQYSDLAAGRPMVQREREPYQRAQVYYDPQQSNGDRVNGSPNMASNGRVINTNNGFIQRSNVTDMMSNGANTGTSGTNDRRLYRQNSRSENRRRNSGREGNSNDLNRINSNNNCATGFRDPNIPSDNRLADRNIIVDARLIDVESRTTNYSVGNESSSNSCNDRVSVAPSADATCVPTATSISDAVSSISDHELLDDITCTCENCVHSQETQRLYLYTGQPGSGQRDRVGDGLDPDLVRHQSPDGSPPQEHTDARPVFYSNGLSGDELSPDLIPEVFNEEQVPERLTGELINSDETSVKTLYPNTSNLIREQNTHETDIKITVKTDETTVKGIYGVADGTSPAQNASGALHEHVRDSAEREQSGHLENAQVGHLETGSDIRPIPGRRPGVEAVRGEIASRSVDTERNSWHGDTPEQQTHIKKIHSDSTLVMASPMKQKSKTTNMNAGHRMENLKYYTPVRPHNRAWGDNNGSGSPSDNTGPPDPRPQPGPLPRRIVVFFTYSWNDVTDQPRFLTEMQHFITTLKNNGIDVKMDTDAEAFRQLMLNRLDFIDENLNQADFVIACITPTYYQDVKAPENDIPAPRPIHLNARYIFNQLRDEIYRNHSRNKRVIPVIFRNNGATMDHVPESYRSTLVYTYPDHTQRIIETMHGTYADFQGLQDL